MVHTSLFSKWGALFSIAVLLSACNPPSTVEPDKIVVESLSDTAVPSLPDPHSAARKGNIGVLQEHFRRGLSIDSKDTDGKTLLHVAIAANQVDTVRWLMIAGSDIEMVDPDGLSPVELADSLNHVAISEVLRGRWTTVPPKLPSGMAHTEESVYTEDISYGESILETAAAMPEEWKELEFSTWTSAAGQQVEAVFLDMTGDIVSLGNREGRVSRVHINQLHREDQIRVRQMTSIGQRAPSGRMSGADMGPTTVTTGFSNECERIIIRTIQQAREEVLVAIYTITRPSIAQALSSAARRNVRVVVKYDAGQVDTSSMNALIGNMQARGVELIPITMSARFASMHHKFIVVDRKKVITGSFNFTNMAATQNYENCVLIESPAIVRDFVVEFERIRSR